MKKIFLFASIVGAAASVYYLYERQLGAISFFLLSAFFFSLAVIQLSKQPASDEKKAPDGNPIISPEEKPAKNCR